MSSETRRETAPRPAVACPILTHEASAPAEAPAARASGHHEQALGAGT